MLCIKFFCLINMEFFWLFIVIGTFGVLHGLQFIPEKPDIEYLNPKYVKYFKFTIHRKGRGSPYYLNLAVESLSGCGNNLTLGLKMYESLGGNYVPTGIEAEYRICDFLDKEPYLGKMFKSQLPPNLTCPFKAGFYELKDLKFELEDFPFNIPFTFGSISVRTRSDVVGYTTETKEVVLKYKFYATIIQKPKNKNTVNNNKH